MAIDKRLIDAINESQITMIILSEDKYNQQRISLAEIIAKNYKKVCYITNNKPYITIVKDFKKLNIDLEKFVFIDISPAGGKLASSEKCIVIRSASDLNELGVQFSILSNKTKFDNVLFDSIGTLEVYADSKTITKFIHDIITKVRMAESKILLMTSSGEKSSQVSKDLYMFVDKVINL